MHALSHLCRVKGNWYGDIPLKLLLATVFIVCLQWFQEGFPSIWRELGSTSAASVLLCGEEGQKPGTACVQSCLMASHTLTWIFSFMFCVLVHWQNICFTNQLFQVTLLLLQLACQGNTGPWLHLGADGVTVVSSGLLIIISQQVISGSVCVCSGVVGRSLSWWRNLNTYKYSPLMNTCCICLLSVFRIPCQR